MPTEQGRPVNLSQLFGFGANHARYDTPVPSVSVMFFGMERDIRNSVETLANFVYLARQVRATMPRRQSAFSKGQSASLTW